MSNMICYYHGGCPDGWAAAYVVKKRYPDAELVPLSYGSVDIERMVEEVKGKNVIMVDFSLKTRKDNDRVAASALNLLILDHHKSQLEIIGDAPYAVFDMNRSGVGLAWDYMFGKDASEYAVYGYELNVGPYDGPENPHVVAKHKADYEAQEAERKAITGTRSAGVARVINRPWWVNYTEDQDLWRFKLNASRQVNGWLNVQERTVEHWDEWLKNEEPANAARMGYGIQAQVDYTTKAAMKDLQEGVWLIEGRNYKVGIVNNGHVGTSEIGEAVYNAGYDIALMWREDGRGLMRFGLRSITVDVGKLASMFEGGGGHKNSAGFELGIAAGRDLIDWLLGRVLYVPPRCV
jgi:oligoribonuclease NrnB/cAMP/cGMP phosphodiesterase (DHH superfamily)